MRLTAEQLGNMANESGLVLTVPHGEVVRALRQAARDARTIEGLKAWLKATAQQYANVEVNDAGAHYEWVLDELSRLEREG